MKQSLFIVLSVFMLTACSMHPLGISKKQWESMSQEQQFAAYQQQAKLDEQEQQRRHELYLLEQEREQQRIERKNELRKQMVPGELLECNFDRVALNVGDKWQPIISQSIELLRDDAEKIQLKSKNSSYRDITLKMAFDGLNVAVCDDSYRNDCDQLSATTQQFHKGIGKQISTSRLQGNLFCQFYATNRPYYLH